VPSPTQERGADHEALAERVLAGRGFVIIERNWRGGGGEVDRVAWDGDILCFIEVRSRADETAGAPEETVGVAKRRKIIRAAKAFLLRFPPERIPMVRFDVIGVVGAPGAEDARVTVIENAFDERARST
jgi:putative endonuclease